MKKLLFCLLVPVFYTYGPNAVGYSTIINTTLSDPAVARGDLMFCSVISEYGDHRLIEGKLLTKTPFIILSDTDLFNNVPVPMGLYPKVEFCVVSGGKL